MTAQVDTKALWRALGTVLDPELGYSITDLGLVYEITQHENSLDVLMTLTSPACPRPEFFEENIVAAIQNIAPVLDVHVRFTFTPAWSLDKATETTRAELAAKGIPLSRW